MSALITQEKQPGRFIADRMRRKALEYPLAAIEHHGEMNLRIEQAESGSRFTELRLIGRLDSESAPALDEQLEALSGWESNGLVLDFENLSYLSSAGIRSLFTAQSQCIGHGGSLRVLAPQPAVLKVLETVRILAPGAIVQRREDIEKA